MNYGKVYCDLIYRAKTRSSTIDNMERHHAFPYHWFNEDEKKSYDWSIVLLTRKEHFIAHRLLVKIFPDSQEAKMAFGRMINTTAKRKKYKPSSRVYETAKEELIVSIKAYRRDPVKDKHRRKVCSKRMKELWNQGYFDFLTDIRLDPVKDQHRRKVCSELMIERNKNGLIEETKKRNKNLSHMNDEQIHTMREKQKKALKGKVPVIFLDGSNGIVDKEYYDKHKNKKCYHSSSKKAAELRGKDYRGGRKTRSNPS